MTMSIDEFVELNETQKLDLLYEHGVYIGKKQRGSRVLMLYQLDSFYVEIIYVDYRRRVERIRTFASTAGIDSYLEKIDIENLTI